MKTPRRPRLTLVTSTPAVTAATSPRTLMASLLGRCSEPQRTMLALLLVERLSSVEAAATLGVPVGQFERSYRSLIADLRREMDRTNHGRWRTAGRRATLAVARMRKAS